MPNGDHQGDQPNIFLTNDTLTEQKAICEVLGPFSHTYLSVAQSLSILYKNSMLETEFIKFVINNISNKVTSGTCPYGKCPKATQIINIIFGIHIFPLQLKAYPQTLYEIA